MPQCTGVTRDGAPCRKWALKASYPPLCYYHKPQTGVTREVPQAVIQLASPTTAESRDLSAELRLVRDVLNRLADRLDDPEYTLLPADMRALAMLIFSGVRTVAYLLSQEETESDELQTWLDQTLDKLSAGMSAEF